MPHGNQRCHANNTRMSPTTRSLNLLRREGWTVGVTERWNPHARIRQDLFGFADLLAFRGAETLLVQVTTGGHVAARVQKIQALPASDLWLAGANRGIVVHGWRKVGSRGKRKAWACRVVRLAAVEAGEAA